MKTKTLITTAALFLSTSGFAAGDQLIGVVNFSSCLTESKAGKKEQENLETIRKEIVARAQDTEKELKEMRAKSEDSDFMDGLSPKAEEELHAKIESLEQDLARYDQQYNQIMQFSQYQMANKMVGDIAKASEKVANDKHLSYIINKDACFYVSADLDVTHEVIDIMNMHFEEEAKNAAEKQEAAGNEAMENKAG